MLREGVVWFLVADGRRARLFVEAVRGAVLQERTDWAMSLSDEDAYQPQDRPPRSFDRVGPGRHAMDKGRDLHEAEEEKFLNRLAQRLADAARQEEFAHLAIAAPPRALGLLREALADPARSRLRATLDKDLLAEQPAQLRERLQDMLRAAT